MEVAACSQVQLQVVPPSSDRMSPNVVASPISWGLSSGNRIPKDSRATDVMFQSSRFSAGTRSSTTGEGATHSPR